MFFNSSYGEIYYEVHGLEDSMVVAFNHGLSVDHHMFDKQVSDLKNLYRVITWDMPEHGQSVKLEKEFDFSVAAKCFIELLDEIGIERVVLVGTSLGGYVSQYIAYKYPERVKGVVVVGSTPLHVKFSKLSVIGFKFHSLLTKLLPWGLLKYLIEKMLGPTSLNQKEYIKETFSKLDKRELLRLSEGTKKGVIKGIEKPIQQPVLITHGEHEMFFIRKMSANWHKNNPDSTYAVISGEGHAASFDNPQEFNEIMQSFLKKL